MNKAKEERTPNWTKWRPVPDVRLWEGVALSLNIEPAKVKRSRDGWMANSLLFDERDEFEERIFVAERNLNKAPGLTTNAPVVKGRLNNCHVALGGFATWACSIDWEVPPQFAELVVGYKPANATQLAEHPNAKSDATLSVSRSDYWNRLQSLTERALAKYPEWRSSQGKIQKTANLQDWLTEKIGANTREAEIIKKVLSDFFD